MAKEGWPPVEKALKGLKKLDDQWERLHADESVPLGDSRFERIAISTERQFETVGFAYAPVLEHIATVHLLCANCLEATINGIGKEVLTGRCSRSSTSFRSQANGSSCRRSGS